MNELTELEGTKLMLKRCQELWKEDMIKCYNYEQLLMKIRTVLETKSTLYDGDEMDRLEDCEDRLERIKMLLN